MDTFGSFLHSPAEEARLEKIVMAGKAKTSSAEEKKAVREAEKSLKYSMALTKLGLAVLRDALKQSMLGKKERATDDDTYLLYGGYEPLSVKLTTILNNKAGIGWTSCSHTGVPVQTSAIGVGHCRGDAVSGRRDQPDWHCGMDRGFFLAAADGIRFADVIPRLSPAWRHSAFFRDSALLGIRRPRSGAALRRGNRSVDRRFCIDARGLEKTPRFASRRADQIRLYDDGALHGQYEVTTLLMAYVSGYMALLMVLLSKGVPVVHVLNLNYIAAEIMKTVVGSFGLVAVAPFTGIVGGFLFINRYR
jgi:hypothetical protein